VATASTVVLTDTGLTANFPAGTYVDDEIYAWTTGYNAGETYTFTASPDTFDSTDLDEAAETLFTLNDRWKAVVFAGRQVDSTAAAVIAENETRPEGGGRPG
jgi:hypothetical protein